MERPVFILGSHKSGTSLLRGLLDGTKELFVVPIEAHFFQYSGHWVDYALRRSLPERLSFDDLVSRFAAHINKSNAAPSKTGDSSLIGRWNVERFITHLRTEGRSRFLQVGLRGFLDSYVEAIHVSLYGRVPHTNRYVEKSVENAEYATVLKALYPRARFIHLVRNPYATVVSLRKHMTRDHYPFLGNALAALNNSFYHLYKNPMTISDYKILRYEDLVTRSEEVTQDIAEFIEIEYADSLLKPTSMGEPWSGNSTSGQRFSGISSQPILAWKQEIHSLEIRFVNHLFSQILRDYGYQRMESKGSAYRPMQGESIKSYLANRLMWRLKIAARTASDI